MSASRREMIGAAEVWLGDCLDVLRGMAEASVDSVVADPPYHLTSIVKRFGADNAAPAKSTGPTGVYGRASAGFMGKTWDGGDVAARPETWAEVYRVMKPGAHLVAFGGTRTYHRMACAIEDAGFEVRDQLAWCFGTGFPKSHNLPGGLGTALKPAWEPIVLARKPLACPTVAANVLKHGTGALNIEQSRVRLASRRPDAPARGRDGEASADRRYTDKGGTNFAATPGQRGGDPAGRWPANLCHDGSPEVLEAFAAFGERTTAGNVNPTRQPVGYHGGAERTVLPISHHDTGTAARFFYSAKASKAERAGSKHPTVKPVALMRWLCRLVTPPGGVVLDPFAGSGTTGEAALREGFSAVLIEREAEYVADIHARLGRLRDEAPLLAEVAA